jgi:hypothetical protein
MSAPGLFAGHFSALTGMIKMDEDSCWYRLVQTKKLNQSTRILQRNKKFQRKKNPFKKKPSNYATLNPNLVSEKRQ